MNFNRIKKWFLKGIPNSDSILENRRTELAFNYLFTYGLILLFSFPFFFTKLSSVQLSISLLGLIGAILPLFLLKWTNSYRVAALVYVILGIIINTLSVVVFSHGVLDARLFSWYLVHILYAFFSLGNKAGIISMMISLLISVCIPLGRSILWLEPFYQNQENSVLFIVISNALSYLFIYFIIDSFIKIFQGSNSKVQELIGIQLNSQRQIIDVNNHNLALTEEFNETQIELENNYELLQNLDSKIHDTEKHSLAIHDAAPVGILIFNLDGKCIYANPKAISILGLSFPVNNWLDTVSDKDTNGINSKWEEFIRLKSNFSADFRVNVNNKERWIQARISPIKEEKVVTSFIGTISNITNAQKEKELLYVLFEMVDQTLDIFFVTNKFGEIVYLNKAASAFLNPKISDTSKHIYNTNWMKSKEAWELKISNLEIYGFLNYERETKNPTSSENSFLEITERLYTFRNVEYVITTAKDRTEKIEQEKKLERNKIFLNNAQTIAKIGSFERDFKTKHYFFSDYLYELFQLPKDTELSRFDFRQYISPEDYEYINAVFKEKIRKEKSFSLMYRIVNNDGTLIPVLTTVEILRNKSGAVSKISGTIQNLTEQYKWDKLNRDLVDLQSAQTKNKLEIEERKLDLIEKKSQLKEERIRISSVLAGQENERKRLSRELHDGLGQMLTAIKLKVEMIDVKGMNSDQIQSYIQQIKLDIKNTIFETRKISQDLMPSALEDFGITSALRILSEDFSQVKGIKVILKDRNFNAELPSEIKITLFRIVQEAFSNISKHSNATKCVIDISNEDEVIYLNISDNGTTFKKEAFGKGSGIINMKERTELLNGNFSIIQTKENACEIYIEIPLIEGKEIKLSPRNNRGGYPLNNLEVVSWFYKNKEVIR